MQEKTLFIPTKYLKAVEGDPTTAELLYILHLLEAHEAAPMPIKLLKESMTLEVSQRTIQRRLSKLEAEGILVITEGGSEGKPNTYHVQEDVVAQRADMGVEASTISVDDLALSLNENLKKWVVRQGDDNLSPPHDSLSPLPRQPVTPSTTKKSSKRSNKNDISFGTLLAYIQYTVSNVACTVSNVYTLSNDTGNNNSFILKAIICAKSKKFVRFGLNPSPKTKQKRKNSYYTWQHYNKYTPEEWKAARTDGLMPGKEQRHTLLIGAYLLGLHEKHGIDVGLVPSDFNGKYGKLAKEMLDFFTQENEGNALVGFNKALDWVKEFISFPKDSFYGKEGWPIQMCFTRDVYRMAGKKKPSGYKSINNTGEMVFTDEQRRNRKGTAIIGGKVVIRDGVWVGDEE